MCPFVKLSFPLFLVLILTGKTFAVPVEAHIQGNLCNCCSSGASPCETNNKVYKEVVKYEINDNNLQHQNLGNIDHKLIQEVSRVSQQQIINNINHLLAKEHQNQNSNIVSKNRHVILQQSSVGKDQLTDFSSSNYNVQLQQNFIETNKLLTELLGKLSQNQISYQSNDATQNILIQLLVRCYQNQLVNAQSVREDSLLRADAIEINNNLMKILAILNQRNLSGGSYHNIGIQPVNPPPAFIPQELPRPAVGNQPVNPPPPFVPQELPRPAVGNQPVNPPPALIPLELPRPQNDRVVPPNVPNKPNKKIIPIVTGLVKHEVDDVQGVVNDLLPNII